MKKRKISPTMVIADVLKEWPQTIPVFQKHKMGCVGCVMAPFETISEAAAIYELSLFKFLEDLNSAILQGRTFSPVVQNTHVV